MSDDRAAILAMRARFLAAVTGAGLGLAHCDRGPTGAADGQAAAVASVAPSSAATGAPVASGAAMVSAPASAAATMETPDAGGLPDAGAAEAGVPSASGASKRPPGVSVPKEPPRKRKYEHNVCLYM